MMNSTATGQDIELSGYCVDLLNKLSENLGFRYTLYIVEDGNYGKFDKDTRAWNGIVADVINRVRIHSCFFPRF